MRTLSVVKLLVGYRRASGLGKPASLVPINEEN